MHINMLIHTAQDSFFWGEEGSNYKNILKDANTLLMVLLNFKIQFCKKLQNQLFIVPCIAY